MEEEIIKALKLFNISMEMVKVSELSLVDAKTDSIIVTLISQHEATSLDTTTRRRIIKEMSPRDRTTLFYFSLISVGMRMFDVVLLFARFFYIPIVVVCSSGPNVVWPSFPLGSWVYRQEGIIIYLFILPREGKVSPFVF